MAIETTRAQVIASIWQAIAQSGVDMSTVPQVEQEKLVSKVADNLLATVNSMLDEVEAAQAPAEVEMEAAEPGEQILWKGRPYLSLIESYIITTDRLKVVRGMVGRNIENYELVRIQDIDYKQNVTERMMGIGDITIRGHDPSHAEIVLRNIPKPEEVYELLRKAWLEAPQRHGLQFREYM